MKRIYNVLAPAALLSITACAGSAYQQQYVQEPPTLTQMQGQCFSTFKDFTAQTNCIRNAVTTSGFALDSHIQEYLLLMDSLREKVNHKRISESDARLKLASKLSEIKAQQQNEFAVQEQLDNQQAAQNAELIRQIQSKAQPLELPQRRSPINTNCQTIGNQVNCTSRQW